MLQTGKQLGLGLLLVGVLLAAGGYPVPLRGAETEFELLTIEGNLIGLIEPAIAPGDPMLVISTYYNLLPAAVKAQANSLYRQYRRLIPDLAVAVAAADSAETTEVKEDMNTLWGYIRTIHTQHYQREVVDLLDAAYDVLGASDTRTQDAANTTGQGAG